MIPALQQLLRFKPSSSPLTFMSLLESTANATSYSYSNVDIGPAKSKRVVIVAAKITFTAGTPSISDVQIGGVSGTLALNVADIYVYYRALTSGQTTTVDVTTDTTSSSNSCAVYAGLTDNPAPVDNQTAFSSGSSASADMVGLVGNGGFAIAVAQMLDTSDRVATWAGGFTKDVDTFPEAATRSNFTTASRSAVGSFTTNVTFAAGVGAGNAGVLWWGG